MRDRYSKEEILKCLSLVKWDIPYSAEMLYDLLVGKVSEINGFTRQNLYTKIVSSFNWHRARKIIPPDQLKDALSDQVIQGLFPLSLREKYRNVRVLL